MARAGVLTFGDFVTKSGRRTPYFINTGRYRTGAQLAQLGSFYAEALLEHFGEQATCLYGPAYKGIPLAVTTAIAAASNHARDLAVTFNRKEAKDHGEAGLLVGHEPVPGDQVVVIEDVTTAGTSVRETVAILEARCRVRPIGVLVSVDRMERGTGSGSALGELATELGLRTAAIVTIEDVLATLHNQPSDGEILIDDQVQASIRAYLREYGAS